MKMIKHIGSFVAQPVFTVAAIRQIEKRLFAAERDPFAVMQRAAQMLFKHIAINWPDSQHFVIVVGGGNNGGDGLLLARLLKQAELNVLVLDCAKSERRGDALKAFDLALADGVDIEPFDALRECVGSVVVDGVLGIGARLPLDDALCSVVDWINRAKRAGASVMAIDLPTGVDADTGYAQAYVAADITLSMVQPKIGHVLGVGSIASGRLVNESLGSNALLSAMSEGDRSSLAVASFSDQIDWFDVAQLAKHKPCPRFADSHKGRYGHVAVFGGDHGYGGAAIMASEAAAKSGAGTVALMTRGEHVAASLVRNPNVMAFDLAHERAMSLGIRKDTVVVLGPGLGREEWGEALFQRVMALSLPLVLDADGLFWLAQLSDVSLPEGAVITPHLGEAARLLGWRIDAINRSPIEASVALAKQYACVVVLKGLASVIANPQGQVYIAGKSEPVLSKGGSGDVLSGMLGATLAYYKTPLEAALMAVSWHNYAAGEMAGKRGGHRAQPYDVLEYLD
jgi:NAD(P)H-hydrate epimerase